jgi:lactate dehydrogenase-like 2-hydroxyacid dehydrogenase
MTEKPMILISSPLEDEHVARIRSAAGNRVQVVHEPDLLPTPRYVADHKGAPRTVTPEMLARWSALLAKADILFDFDLIDPANMPRNAPKLRWVQATSSGIGEFLKKTGLDKSGIVFTTAAGVHARPLAEFAMLGMLYFYRDVPFLNRRKQAKHWERYTARGLVGSRVLIIGLGVVGRAIARDAAFFGMDVWHAPLRRTAARGRQPDHYEKRTPRGTAARRRPGPCLSAHGGNPRPHRPCGHRGLETRRRFGQRGPWRCD